MTRKSSEAYWIGRAYELLEIFDGVDDYGNPIAPPVATGIEALVCADIAARQQVGIKKYGTTLADNPLTLLQWLEHSYAEKLDDALCMKRAIEELKREGGK